MAKAPDFILSIQGTNPDPPSDFSGSGAATITYGQPSPSTVLGGAFPSRDAKQEWKQVLAPAEDYESDLIGATGWVLDPHASGADLPFTHPFGWDWEFMMALDAPYAGLLARGNQVPDAEEANLYNDAAALGIPLPSGPDGAPSLLGVEIDGGLVPTAFTNGVGEGDRVAVFGRWIVDCGHAVTVPVPNAGDPTFRSEIHPPLLMATARVVTGSLVTGATTGPEVTRVLLTSRPYLAGQHFVEHPDDNRYDDQGSDDGPLWDHLLHEVSKVNTTLFGIPLESWQVEAHQKIKSHPFQGVYLAHLVLKPPQGGGGLGGPGGHHLGGVVAPMGHLSVAFQFTARTGIGVQVLSLTPGAVDVLITLSSAGYTSPELPPGHNRTWTKDDLATASSSASGLYSEIQWMDGVWETLGNVVLDPLSGGILSVPTVEAILGRGVVVDEYDTSPMTTKNILDTTHAFTGEPSAVPGGAGVVVDDTQPFPIFGWIEVAWVDPQMHL